MIKIFYLKNWIYQESWYPVLFFQWTHSNDFIHLKQSVHQLSWKSFSFDFASRKDLYELVNLDSVIFESKNKAKVLSKLYDNSSKFITSLDSSYWEYFEVLIEHITDPWYWHIYSDDSVMLNILPNLEDEITIIFDKSNEYFDLKDYL
jgi:hypothetical protein